MFKKNYNKNFLVKKLSLKIGFSENLSKKIVDDFFEIIKLNIKTGYFNLKNLGSFKIVQKKERLGRNPKTKTEYIITPRNVAIFTLSKKIKNYLSRVNE